MSARPLRRDERDQNQINEAIQQLQRGRINAHGTFTLDDDNVAVSTAVDAITCAENTDVNITPTNANAANMIRTADVYVVAGAKSFTVYHDATALTCTFSYSING